MLSWSRQHVHCIILLESISTAKKTFQCYNVPSDSENRSLPAQHESDVCLCCGLVDMYVFIFGTTQARTEFSNPACFAFGLIRS